MTRLELGSDDYRKVKILGSGNFGNAYQCEITNNQALTRLREMGLIEANDNKIVIKELKIPANADEQSKARIENNYLSEIENCEYLYNLAANRKLKKEIHELNDVHYNLSHGINIDGKTYLASRLEGFDIYKGSAKEFFKEFSEATKNLPELKNDSLIYAVSAMAQIKRAISELHNDDFLHLDIAARNVFISRATLLDSANLASAPIKIEVKLGDFGTGILPHQLDTSLCAPVSAVERLLAPRWLDHEARSGDQSQRVYSPTTDLCGFRTTVAELLMYISDRFQNELPWYHYPIEQRQDGSKINHFNLLLENKSDSDRFRILCNSLKMDESIAPTLAIFYNYLISPPKRTAEVKQNLIHDQQLFQKALDHFFVYFLNNRLEEINIKNDADKNNMRVTLKKLLELPVSEELKNSSLFQACEKLADKEKNREKHIKAIKNELNKDENWSKLKEVNLNIFKPVLGERIPESSPHALKGKDFESQRNLQDFVGRQKNEKNETEESQSVKQRSGSMYRMLSTSKKKLKDLFTQKASATPTFQRKKATPEKASPELPNEPEPNQAAPSEPNQKPVDDIAPNPIANPNESVYQNGQQEKDTPYWQQHIQSDSSQAHGTLKSTSMIFQKLGVLPLEKQQDLAVKKDDNETKQDTLKKENSEVKYEIPSTVNYETNNASENENQTNETKIKPRGP